MHNSFEHLNSSSSMEKSDDCIEKKKQQRLEREKQRENQKIKREQRRKLRHDSFQTKINQSTEIEGDETAKTEGNKDETGNQSDPDWEGFEEFSSSGSDSREENKRDPQTEDLTENNWNWDNDNQKNNTKFSHLNSTDISSKSNHHNNALTLNSKLLLSNQLQPDNSFTESSFQLDTLHLPTIIGNDGNIQTVQTKSIENDGIIQTVQTKSEKNIFKNNTTINNNSIKEKNLKKDLGSEFDIQVLNKLAEPDYFVDMVPNFKNEIKTVVIDINTVPTVSSKFAVTEILQDEPTAWDDDGWGSE